jgi:hypothetical protein
MSWTFGGSAILGSAANAASLPASVSVFMWVYPTSLSIQTLPIIWRTNSGNSLRYAALYINTDGTVEGRMRDDAGFSKWAASTATVSTSTWNLIGFTFDGSSGANPVVVYVGSTSRNVNSPSDTYTTLAGANELFAVGGFVTPGQLWNGNEFTGQIAYPTIWSAALSGTDVSSLLTNLPSSVQTASIIRAWTPDSYVDTIGGVQTLSAQEGSITTSGNNPSLAGVTTSLKRMLTLGAG